MEEVDHGLRRRTTQHGIKKNRVAPCMPSACLPLALCSCVRPEASFFFFKTRIEITVVAHLRGSLSYIVIYKTSGILNTQPIYRPGCRAMQNYMLSMGGAWRGRQLGAQGTLGGAASTAGAGPHPQPRARRSLGGGPGQGTCRRGSWS